MSIRTGISSTVVCQIVRAAPTMRLPVVSPTPGKGRGSVRLGREPAARFLMPAAVRALMRSWPLVASLSRSTGISATSLRASACRTALPAEVTAERNSPSRRRARSIAAIDPAAESISCRSSSSAPCPNEGAKPTCSVRIEDVPSGATDFLSQASRRSSSATKPEVPSQAWNPETHSAARAPTSCLSLPENIRRAPRTDLASCIARATPSPVSSSIAYAMSGEYAGMR